MSRPSKIQVFQGTTPKPTRDYLTFVFKALQDRYSRLMVPCVGRFTIPQLACGAGWSADRIVSSDISLFSTVVGYHVCGKDLAELGIVYRQDLGWLAKHDGTEKAAGAAMFAMKLGQFGQSDNYYNGAMRDELQRAPELYVDRFQAQFDELRKTLGGSDYRMADVFAQMQEVEEDPEAIIYINPPAYRRGYEKMFDFGDVLTWNAPEVPEFDPKNGIPAILDYARRAKALTIWYRYKAVTEDESPVVVFGHEYRADRVDYTLCNRPEETMTATAPRKPTALTASKMPIVPFDHDITPETAINAVPVNREVALYYRDLFAHKLGVTRAEQYFLFALDGFVFGIVGMHLSDASRRRLIQGAYQVCETFGFNASTKYTRLNRLLMMCLTTRQFLRALIEVMPVLAYVHPIVFQTTCLADVPELKTNRGILKLRERKKLPNGKYHLNYISAFRPEDYAKARDKWLGKHALTAA